MCIFIVQVLYMNCLTRSAARASLQTVKRNARCQRVCQVVSQRVGIWNSGQGYLPEFESGFNVKASRLNANGNAFAYSVILIIPGRSARS